ncbi:MAG: DinB family protein [Bacteroidota bacterium]|nr:DinB family protein [Bacteroidota bacterium]
MSFNKWEHLFLKGEYPSRDKLLSGLTLEQVTTIPKGLSHSIYEEFWHLTEWQDVVISDDKNKDESWDKGNTFPPARPNSLRDWEELKKKFNDGVKKILEYSSVPGNLEKEIEPGFNIDDSLSCLAVHNSVHFGKILAIRQMLGTWPPKEEI